MPLVNLRTRSTSSGRMTGCTKVTSGPLQKPTGHVRAAFRLQFAEIAGYFATCAQTLTGGHHDGCNLRHAFCSLVIMPLARSSGGGNALTAGVTPK
jgi:hypothetical protein